jgi:hypothetical protein
MKLLPRRFCFAMILLYVSSTPASAQRVIHVPPDVSCARCRIDIEPVFSIGHSPRQPPVGFPHGFVRNSRGEYYLVNQQVGNNIAHYDRAGRFLRFLGRPGTGPGEFTTIRDIALRADTLFVYDQIQGRLTVYSPDRTVVRTQPVPGANTRILPLSDGRLVASGTYSTPERVGEPLHVFSMNGDDVRSFGSSTAGLYRADLEDSMRRLIAPASASGEFWAARLNEYVLEKWSAEGRKLAELRRAASWFPPTAQLVYYQPGVAPTPRQTAIWVDAEQRIWTITVVPNENWRTVWEPNSSYPGGMTFNERYENYYNSIIEVIDPGAGRVLARRALRAYFIAFVQDGGLVGYRVNAEGSPVLDVYNVRMR